MQPVRKVLAPVRSLAVALALTGAGSGAMAGSGDGGSGSVSFNRDIRPILADHCLACHGFDAGKRKAGLRLDVAEGATRENGKGRVAVRPGDPGNSELWRRLISTDPDDVMPPPETHKALTEEQKARIRLWIEQGAPYQQHWAFEPPAPVPPPVVADAAWSGGAIDRFVRARMESEGMAPRPEADRATLIRRVSLDLTGLPPTPADVDAFEADRRPDAYERWVDRLLDSPRYGERMAVMWLDLARYADTHGMHLDNERQMWAYRDWVVSAFNRNLPFDQFTVEQLAGDLLPGATPDQRVATGFNRCNVTTSEGGSIDAELIFRYAVDRTATLVETWMGLTAGCAVCHDHKFDPLSQKEFYSLFDFFHSAADPAMDGNALRTPPVMALPTAADRERIGELDREIADAEAAVRAAAREVGYEDPALQEPRPPARDEETVWWDDVVPEGLKAQGSPRFVGAPEGPVFSGDKALLRREGGLGQDVFEGGGPGFEIPAEPRLFAHVHLDPADPPQAIMLQYFRDGWEHRAVWGDVDAINWGEKGTGSRRWLGPLPEAGRWVRLEFPAGEVGLRPGDRVRSVAYTQFGGTVAWDRPGVSGRTDPASDPGLSLAAWIRQMEDPKSGDALPAEVRRILRTVAAADRTEGDRRLLREHFLATVWKGGRERFGPMNDRVRALRAERGRVDEAVTRTFVWADLEKPRESFVMLRGQYDRPGERVVRGVPAVFPPLRTEGVPTRLDLARWLVSPEHPLTARVAVNRWWQLFFGTGLVKTSGDFGTQGQPPSHPDLLDWLAVDFREHGWDVKRLVRMLVTSAAYRQDSAAPAAAWLRDPENRLLARGPRFRLEAEQIRDNALYLGGLLVGTMGGKGVRTYQPPNIWEPVGFVGSNTREYRRDDGQALYRRSLYTFLKRTAPAPFLANFDAPNREQSCARRERSNTPLQALQLMNDVQHFEAARGLAGRLMREGGATDRERLAWGWRLVLARRPAPEEVGILVEALERHRSRYAADPDAAARVLRSGESVPDPALSPTELAAYTLVANLLLNLDETLTRN